MTNPIEQNHIRRVLAFDALTCLGAGVLMAFAAAPLAGLTALSPDLLRVAGIALFPVAALFFTMSRMRTVPRWLIQFAVVGNALWVAASIVLLLVGGGNLLGQLFVAGQAIVVAALALLEARDGFGTAPMVTKPA